MSSDSGSKDDKTSFTVDNDRSQVVDVPSVTKLLNRKSLRSSAPPEKLPPVAPPSFVPEPQSPSAAPAISISIPEPSPSESASPLEISVSIDTSAASAEPELQLQTSAPAATPAPSNKPKIQPSVRKANPSVQAAPALIIWEPDLLQNGSDPMGKGIFLALKKGATSALFLALVPPEAGKSVPQFIATASVLGKAKLGVWTGLKWNPEIVPEMWNYFLKAGQVELGPPGSATNQKSNRNVVRAAFGILPQEWLLLVRAGTAQNCRGIVALISPQSILTPVMGSMTLFSSAQTPPKK